MYNDRSTISVRGMLIVFALFAAIFPPPAWAYLDPGTGSMIISAIVGLFATVGLAVKTYWYKLKSLFRKTPEEAPEADEALEAEQPADR